MCRKSVDLAYLLSFTQPFYFYLREIRPHTLIHINAFTRMEKNKKKKNTRVQKSESLKIKTSRGKNGLSLRRDFREKSLRRLTFCCCGLFFLFVILMHTLFAAFEIQFDYSLMVILVFHLFINACRANRLRNMFAMQDDLSHRTFTTYTSRK